VVLIIHLTEKQGKFKRIKRYTFLIFIPPEGETRKIQKNQRFAALTALSHSAKIVGGALFRVCTSSSVSFCFETKAFA